METTEKKEPYLHILNTQGNIYEEFLPDQVLTHKNLNKVVNYFEDQDRLSRVYLIGVGIGCGINIVSYSNTHIEIGQGVGITTDGDIIKTETRRFQYYSELTDRADYDLFQGRQVYEIYEQEGAGRLLDELPLSSFTSNEFGSLKDYIVIAYVENYTEDEGLCGGSGCDETGNKVYSNLKFLLTHKNNYSALISNDTIYQSHDVLSYYDTLPELCMPRLLLTKSNTTSGISIHDQFKNSFYLKTELYNGITTIIRRFSHRINFAKFNVNILDITTYFDDIFTVQNEQFIQYKYDLLKDLIDTYREIRELILYTRFECVANINAFPKHLLLGTLEEQTRLQKRHNFYPSPTVSENDENLLSIRALCIKFFNQLKEYKIPNVSTAAVKITPSKGYEFKLSERTIPYYYETKNSLITNWNPISIQQRKPKNQLGYHVSNLKNIPCIQDPLKFSHLDKNFYRIEGHIGKDFRLALKKINTLKAKYNLAFDVKTISIGFPVKKITLDDDKCDTKDYAILLKTWEREFACTAESATEFFEKYQFDDLGGNDTSTAIYSLAAQGTPQLLQLVGKEKNEDATTKKIAAKTISTNASAETSQAQAKYETSLQYAIDQAYSHAGTQNVSSLYISTVALGIIDQSLGNVPKDDDYFFYTESPIKIITGLAEIKRNFLESLNEIYNTEKWTALNNAIGQLCADVDQILFKISQAGENSVFGTKTHDKMYEYFVYDLSKICCLKERFIWLKEQIDEIRNNLYRELILSRLIDKHPGAEHMAGVPKGGTFLMVYIGETESILDNSDIVERQFNGLVQFDFALPYMCCSDCPPETIVYNNSEVETTLTIAKTKYCLPSDDGVVDFIIKSSGDGVVTSPEGAAFIVQTDAGYAFDPSGVSDELLGQTLTFLVDGDTPTVPVEICVFKYPQDVVATYALSSWNAEGINLDLNVNHELDTLSYFTYSWTREDGTEIGTEKDLLEEFFANPEESFVEDFKLIIGVEGFQDGCTDSYGISVNETREVEISVVVPEIICHNTQETSPAWVPVTVTPNGATLKSPQVAAGSSFIIQDQSGNYFIDPARVPDELAGEPITFTVNDTPVNNVMTRVAKLPSFINRDEQGNDLQAYGNASWNSEGVKIDIQAVHKFQDETYIEYRWINTDTDEELGTTRVIQTIYFEVPEQSATVNLKLEMRVIGLEDSCNTAFSVNFTIARETFELEKGYCYGGSIEAANIPIPISPAEVEVTSPQGNEFIVPNGDEHVFKISAVQPHLIGRRIGFEIDESEVAHTYVYQIPQSVAASYQVRNWEGDNLIVDLEANYYMSGINNPEDYLEVTWFDENGDIINDPTGHIIQSDNGSVDKTYKVIITVKSELMDTTPCVTDSVEIPIRENQPTPEPTLPPNLDLEGKYCWKRGTTNLIITIPVSPNDFNITSPQGSTFLIPNSDSYTFNAFEILDEESGNEIQFQLDDGTIVGRTRIYKLPADASLQHDVNNSQLSGNEYFFRLEHDYGQKNYMQYDALNTTTGQVLIPVSSNPLIYRVSATNEPRSFTCKVIISLEGGLICATANTFTVAVPGIQTIDPNPIDPIDPPGSGTTNPLGRLVCETPYSDRLNEVGVNKELIRLRTEFDGKPYENGLKTNVLAPIGNIVTVINRSKDLKTDSIESIGQLNNMRIQLQNNLLNNSNTDVDKNLFLNLDEILELMSLELLRCVDDDTAALLMTSIKTTSDDRNIDYGADGGSRTKITNEYLATFNDKNEAIRNVLNTTFSTKTR